MNEYRDVHASLLRFVAQFCAELNQFGFNLTPLNLDAFANPTDWPAGDFVGLAEFVMDTDGKLVDVMAAIVVSTREDVNLMRMTDLTNRVLNKVMPGSAITVVDAKAGTPRGRLYVTGNVRAGAVQNTVSQPALPIMLRFKADRALSP